MSAGPNNFGWPDSFPDQCPPAEASPSRATFYRFVDDPISERNFWGHRALIDAKLIAPLRHPADPCELEGVSLFDSMENAERVRKSNGRLKKMSLASGSLDNSGVVKPTRSQGHHTWWRPTGDQSWQNFQVVT